MAATGWLLIILSKHVSAVFVVSFLGMTKTWQATLIKVRALSV